MEASIGVGFASLFSLFVKRSIVIIPNGETGSGLLVVDPATPEQYAKNGTWFYVNSLSEEIPEIEASVGVGNYSASSPATFELISDDDQTLIPLEVFENIVRHLEQAGFNVVNSTDDALWRAASMHVRLVTHGSFTRLAFTDDLSASELARILPPIHFELVSVNEQLFRLTLSPEDYIQAVASGHITSVATRDGNFTNVIGTNLLRHLALQLDYEIYRIGFADPIDEV